MHAEYFRKVDEFTNILHITSWSKFNIDKKMVTESKKIITNPKKFVRGTIIVIKCLYKF